MFAAEGAKRAQGVARGQNTREGRVEIDAGRQARKAARACSPPDHRSQRQLRAATFSTSPVPTDASSRGLSNIRA
ncbi:hypothetical protein OVY29_11715 [Sphingopyxis sp. SE2]|uniref:hypothetical protein n=1 Tax=Sphingopyxis sp. SE2 TaxID=1586240 RepID=UPI0028C2ADEF|nr:hypothetical protein [Sphingopyxis sp. SE2]MDT7529331.1 hypothetical protein [Sphingopyxis sp. SE2]